MRILWWNTTCHFLTNAPWMKSNLWTHLPCSIPVTVDGWHLEMMPRVRTASRTSNGPVVGLLRLTCSNSPSFHRSTRYHVSQQSKCQCSGTRCRLYSELGRLLPSRLGTRAWDHGNSGEDKQMHTNILKHTEYAPYCLFIVSSHHNVWSCWVVTGRSWSLPLIRKSLCINLSQGARRLG